LRELAVIAEAGKLAPVLDSQQYKMQEVALAHQRLASGKAMGKVVIEID
jgi:NADPH2:quinone reductase